MQLVFCIYVSIKNKSAGAMQARYDRMTHNDNAIFPGLAENGLAFIPVVLVPVDLSPTN
jgi:hypothetical protein